LDKYLNVQIFFMHENMISYDRISDDNRNFIKNKAKNYDLIFMILSYDFMPKVSNKRKD